MSSSSSSFFIPSQPVPGGGFDLGAFGFGGLGGFGFNAPGLPGDFRFTGQVTCPPCCPDGPPGNVSGSGGVRSFNGMVVLTAGAALTTNGFKYPFGTEISYNNFAATVSNGFGKGWVPSSGLSGLTMNAGEVLYHESPTSVKAFLPISTSGSTTTYQAGYFVLDRLIKVSGVYTLTSPDGSVKVFNNAGRLTSFRNPGGNTGTVTYDPPDVGPLKSISMTDGGTESWKFTYVWNAGYIESVTFSVNGTDVRRSVYAYDSGRLRTILNYAWIDGSWGIDEGKIVEGVRFTYNPAGLLRHVITPTGYQQMLNNGINPAVIDLPAAETTFNNYAETEYEYKDDGSGWVRKMHTHGQQYTYQFDYIPQTQASTSLNVWTAQTDITQPDGSVMTYYFNRGGQVILKQVASGGDVWYEYSQQFEEGSGRLLFKADADAIQSVNPSVPTLVTLNGGAGLVESYAYNVNGYLETTGVKLGAGGTVIKRRRTLYASRNVAAYGTIYTPSSITEYRGSTDATGVTASYANTWHGSTFQLSQRVTTLPVVSTTENGTGTGTTRTENFDISGYLTSTVDERGTVTTYDWSKVRDALKQQVRDQGSGKLNLITDYEVDDLGRTVRELGPVHEIAIGAASTPVRRAQWTYYKDRAGEVMTFGGYQKTTGVNPDQIVGPVTMVRPNDTPPPTGYAGYRTAHRIDAAFTSTGIPLPSTTFTQTSWVRWTVELYDNRDKKMKEWKYFVIPGPPASPQRYNYGLKSINYGEKLYGYDGAGRLDQTTCAGGTIDKTTFNAMGWIEKEELGTSAGLTVTRRNEYYPNGTLKKVTLPVDTNSTNDRVTEKQYDFRQRLIEDKTSVVLEGVNTVLLTIYGYDNRDLPTSVDGYHTSAVNGNYTSSQIQQYDAIGRRYRRTAYPVNATGNLITAKGLKDDWFYDKNGQIARQVLTGSSLATIINYNAVGWTRFVYKATGIYSTSDPTALTSATVIEQTENLWDDGGNLITSISKARFDNATGYGELKDPDTEPKSRNSYVAYYPDGLGRNQAVADYGTNQGVPLTRQPTIPPRSNIILVTSTAYSSAGNVSTVTDPANIITAATWDKADRLTMVVENAFAGGSSSGYATDVRTTRYEYTDDGWLKLLKSDNAATGQQITEWVYGVTKTASPSNPLPSNVNSNRLVRKKIYPDAIPGSGSSSGSGAPEDAVLHAYNAQGQVINMTDQMGNAHAYAYDKMGRLLSDTVSAFGAGVENTINKLENGWNERGLLVRASSYKRVGGAKANEVKWTYNEFNQVRDEHQDHAGPVSGSTKYVRYDYVDGSGNTIRPVKITYPDGAEITTAYVSDLAKALSRPDAVTDSSGTLASMRYLGLSTLVNLKYNDTGTTHTAELTMQRAGSGDGGDIYTGLDRFGRLVETIWKNTSRELVHTSYGRNRVGGVTWQRNDLAHAMSPVTVENTRNDNFYQYDKLRQVTQHQRGDLTGTAPNYSGITNTQQTEGFSYDETGNWLLNTATSPSSLSQTRTHNKVNEIATLTGPAGVTPPLFSAAGNMVSMPKPGAWTTGCGLSWDAWNRLAGLTSGGVTTTNHYDALGRRIVKTISSPSETRDYYYNLDWRSVQENVGSAVKAQHTWSPVDPWILIRRRRSVSGTLDETRYILKDYLDPAAVIAPSASDVDERYSYDAFGPVRILDASFAQKSGNNSTCGWNFFFHAEFRDDESGLYNYGYRFYNPYLGRWLSRDPLKEYGGLNLYCFLNNDSLMNYDILGLEVKKRDCNWVILHGHGTRRASEGTESKNYINNLHPSQLGDCDKLGFTGCARKTMNGLINKRFPGHLLPSANVTNDSDTYINNTKPLENHLSPEDQKKPDTYPHDGLVLKELVDKTLKDAKAEIAKKGTCCKKITITISCLDADFKQYYSQKNIPDGPYCGREYTIP